jgi:hypothetical protein
MCLLIEPIFIVKEVKNTLFWFYKKSGARILNKNIKEACTKIMIKTLDA